MKNNITYLTVCDIQNSQLFFEMINNCLDPVIVLLENGQAKDIRRNIIAQNFFTWIDPYGKIKKIELQCTSCQDVIRIMKFIDKNYMERDE